MLIAKGASQPEQEKCIEELMRELSLDEKIFMLSGHGFLQQISEDEGRYCARLYHVGAGNERLEIPPLLFMDGPRGIAMGESTCFPVSMARGASFDVDLERRIGDAIGRELRAHGGNLFGGVCINLLRHPAWGRAQETYGEDSFHLGEMGVALVRGVQHHNVVATPKHFACNSMENARFSVNVKVDERALREVYLPHFKKCIDAGAGAVMSAYNKVNGAYCGHNEELLTRILKEEWGFDGFVYSDFVMGCRGADASAKGLDVEAPDTIHFGDKLRVAVDDGEVPESRIDDAVRRVLRSLLRILARPDPEVYEAASIACEEHVALAREAAEKSIVMLENRNALPFDPKKIRHLLVLGPLADRANLGDRGSSRVYPPDVVTPLAGLQDYSPDGCEVVFEADLDSNSARELTMQVDAVLVVVGYDYQDEGEYIPVELGGAAGKVVGGDRIDLGLGDVQESLIRKAAGLNPNTIVAVMSGSAVIMENWQQHVVAILMLWYPGMQGGRALADVLWGRVNPSGRLPFSIPASVDDLPYFDRDADEITYDLWHGYTGLAKAGKQPAYPFGYGLSYSKFDLGLPTIDVDEPNESIIVTVELSNSSAGRGAAVLQVYGGPVDLDPSQPEKRLCGFSRIELDGKSSEPVRIAVQLRDLASFDVEQRRWTLAAGTWRIWIGFSSAADDLKAVDVQLPSHSWPIA